MTVYVVLWDNYGDQGVDYRGVFKSREAAERYIDDFVSSELAKLKAMYPNATGSISSMDFRVLEEAVQGE